MQELCDDFCSMRFYLYFLPGSCEPLGLLSDSSVIYLVTTKTAIPKKIVLDAGRTKSTSNSSRHYSATVDWLIESDNNWISDFSTQRINSSPFFCHFVE